MAGRITDIKVQKGNSNRVNVFLDGEYGFSLGLLAAASLSPGNSLTEEEIEQLQLQDSVQAEYDRTLRYLAYRPRSSAEVRWYLGGKGVSGQVRDRVVDRLTAAKLLDDLAFAQYWVENRETFRPRGKRLLRQELRQKGISDGLIDEILGDLDEVRSANEAAVQRVRRYAHLEDQAFREKMYGFLRRRGFDYEVIAATISRLLLQRDEERAADR